MRNNKKGFTLVELLAVIVVLAIVMGIAAVAITNVLDSTRKNAFVASARTYIAGAKTLVNADEVELMLGGTSTYAPKCGSTTDNIKYIPLSKIKTESGENDKSPYGSAFVKATDVTPGSTLATTPTGYGTTSDGKGASYVKVEASGTAQDCTYIYSIFLRDDIYAIGTLGNEVLETALGSSSVEALS